MLIPDSKVNKAVSKVLNSPEFIKARANKKGLDSDSRLLRDIQKFFDKISNFISKHFHINIDSSNLQSKPLSSKAAFIIMCIIIFAVIVALVVFIVKLFLKHRNKFKPVSKADLDDKIDINSDYERLASKSFEAGDIKSAIKFIFRAIIVNLNKKGLVFISDGKTNYQYYLELKKKSFKDIDLYRSCVLIFNDVCYGNKNVGKSAYDRCLQFLRIIK